MEIKDKTQTFYQAQFSIAVKIVFASTVKYDKWAIGTLDACLVNGFKIIVLSLEREGRQVYKAVFFFQGLSNVRKKE